MHCIGNKKRKEKAFICFRLVFSVLVALFEFVLLKLLLLNIFKKKLGLYDSGKTSYCDIINGTMSQLDCYQGKCTQISDNGQMCICKTRKCFQNIFFTK